MSDKEQSPATHTTEQPGLAVEEERSDDASDDDDWFNKSLDDFEVPDVVKGDRWSDEDVDDRREDSLTKNDSRRNAVEAPGNLSCAETAADRDRQSDDPPGDRTQEDGSRPTARERTEETQEKGSEEEVILREAGVAFELVPGSYNKFRLLLAVKTKTTEEVTTDGRAQRKENGEERESSEEKSEVQVDKEKRESEEGNSGVQVDKDEGESKEEESKVQVDKDEGESKEEESKVQVDKEKREKKRGERGFWIFLETRSNDNGNKNNAGPSSQATATVAGEDKREEEQENEREEKLAERKKASPYKFYKLEEAESERDPKELDEAWFRKTLKKLPTLFNNHRIHAISKARLKSRETMIKGGPEEEDDDEKEHEKQDGQDAPYRHEVDNTHVITVILLTFDNGDYQNVFKIERRERAANTGQQEKAANTGQQEKAGNTGQQEKAGNTGQKEKAGNTGQQEKAGNTEQQEKACNIEQQEKAGNTGQQEKAANTEQQEKAGNTGQEEKAGNTEQQEKAGNTEQQEKAGNTEQQERAGNTGQEEKAGNTEQQEKAGNTGQEEKAGNTGQQEQAGNTGQQEKAGNTGQQEKAGNTGQQEKAGNTGQQEKASNTEQQEKAGNTGQQEKAGNTGQQKAANTGQQEKADNTGQKEKAANSGQQEKAGNTGQEEKSGNTGQQEKAANAGQQQKAGDKENRILKWRKGVASRCSAGSSLLVVVQWLLGKKEKAEMKAREVCRHRPLCLVAAANLFYILWQKGDKAGAAEMLDPFMRLKRKKLDLYDRIFYEEIGELGEVYRELGPDFIPEAIAAAEEVVRAIPVWYGFKWEWALNLRRLANSRYQWTDPQVDTVTVLLKAVDLLMDLLQDCERVDMPDTKAMAASELGEILGSCELDETLQKTVGKRAKEVMGLDAAKCFNMVMQIEDLGGCQLVRAGKYFRQRGQLGKSVEALRKAATLQDSPKVHHQLALTLRRMVLAEKRRAWQNSRYQRRGDREIFRQVVHRRGASRQGLGTISLSRVVAPYSKMGQLERSMKAVRYQHISREDQHVSEAMYHFERALKLSFEACSPVSYDLGLMYKALGEYSKAQKQFLLIAEIDDVPANVVCAFEQSGLVNLEQCSLEKRESNARKFQEAGRTMLSMAILIQCSIVQRFRKTQEHQNRAIWHSVYTLGQYLRLQEKERGKCEDDSPVELWLLRLLIVYADTLPVLTFCQQTSELDATDPQRLTAKTDKYLRDQRPEDVVLLTSLLRLTDQWDVLEPAYEHLRTKALVLAARTRLAADAKEQCVGDTFNTNSAKRYFRWSFEDVVHTLDNSQHRVHCSDIHFVSSSSKNEPAASLGPELGNLSSEKDTAEGLPSVERRDVYQTGSTQAMSKQSATQDSPNSSADTSSTVDKIHNSESEVPRSASSAVREGRGSTTVLERKDGAGQNPSRSFVMETETVISRQQTLKKLQDPTEDEDEESQSDDTPSCCHVLLVHDPYDQDAAGVAERLEHVLQKTFGLRAVLPKYGCSDDMFSTMLEAMSNASLLLFVVGDKETSREMRSYLSRAESTVLAAQTVSLQSASGHMKTSRWHRSVRTLTLDNVPPLILPAFLQSYPSLSWGPRDESRLLEGSGPRTEGWVDWVCRLFCFLTEVDVKF